MQTDDIDDDLRNSLWNAVALRCWQGPFFLSYLSEYSDLHLFFVKVWTDLLKLPVDQIPLHLTEAIAEVREYFFNCRWYEVYDFIEFVANNFPDKAQNERFIALCNRYLEREVSGYRFVGGKIIQATSELEISEIEQALEASQPLKPVNTHLKRALDLLSDRKAPDYRNSIKESISAVEAMCRLVAKNPKATLGQALKAVEANVELHPALKEAFSKLYGYTSNADGIRHAMREESGLDFDYAKFMLVTCSAFINYLVAKSVKAGIEL
jgi:hypothetical protein